MAANVLDKSWSQALAEMKVSPQELWSEDRAPLQRVQVYDEYQTASFCMS